MSKSIKKIPSCLENNNFWYFKYLSTIIIIDLQKKKKQNRFCDKLAFCRYYCLPVIYFLSIIMKIT